MPAGIMIDCSHGNSGKEPEKQVEVGYQVATQIANGDTRIFGVMIESHLKGGRQDLMPGKELVYGLSITDACVGWEDTHKLVEDLADTVRQRRVKAEAEAEAE
jgi:3-deoxy-7-phosphoheptulonate synthase